MMKVFQKAYELLIEIMISVGSKKELKRQYVRVEKDTNIKWYQNK
jgi:hypothetical protein